jgi:hypothetical protein
MGNESYYEVHRSIGAGWEKISPMFLTAKIAEKHLFDNYEVYGGPRNDQPIYQIVKVEIIATFGRKDFGA